MAPRHNPDRDSPRTVICTEAECPWTYTGIRALAHLILHLKTHSFPTGAAGFHAQHHAKGYTSYDRAVLTSARIAE
jgi:hypothetical protein